MKKFKRYSATFDLKGNRVDAGQWMTKRVDEAARAEREKREREERERLMVANYVAEGLGEI